MKLTKREKLIYNAVELQFCKALASSPQKVTDAMNSSPCFLGSEKYFEYTAKAVIKALRKG